MPSTEMRRDADLITLIREAVNDAEETGRRAMVDRLMELANDEEKVALIKFSDWFRPTSP